MVNSKKPAAAKRVRMDVDVRKQMLLELGRVYFSKHIYDEISIDDLAREAGISKGLLYHYFPTKRVFYVEVIRAANAQLLKMTDTARDHPPLERLSHGLDAYLNFAEENARTYTALHRSGIGVDAEISEILESSRWVVIGRVLDALDLKKPPAKIRIALRGWIGFTEAVTLEWLEKQELKKEELRKLLVQQLGLTLATAGVGSSLTKLVLKQFGRIK